DMLYHGTVCRILSLRFFRNSNFHVDRVADENRFHKTESIVAFGKSFRINDRCCKTNAYRKNHGAVRDPLSKRLCLTPLCIHVMWEKIACMSCVNYEVCLRNGSSQCYTFIL